jgi:hypothetical protein
MKLTPLQIIKKQEQLKTLRGVWETHWQEIADFVIPRKNQFTRKNVPGEKKGIELYDNTGMVSLEVLVAALHGLLTNPNTHWFSLQTGDPKVDDQDTVILYLQDLARRMHRILNNSNFQPEVYEYFLDLCSVGTAAMSVEEDDQSIVRFSTVPMHELFVAENAKGMIDESHRVFEWTSRQIVEFFVPQGTPYTEDALKAVVGQKVANKFLNGKDDKFEIVHAVYREQVTEREDMPYMSQYILKCDKMELREGRFRRFPYVVSRWSKTSGEIYGRSPAMTALPEIKTLNMMAKTVIKGAQKVVDPPVQMPDDGVVLPFRSVPGGVNFYRAGTTDRIEPIFNDSRIDFGYEAMRERQQRVREAFFVDKLNLVQSDRMTTVEVSQRVQEQLRFLGPLVGRQQTEFLRPLIDRLLDIMVKQDVNGDLLGEVPEVLDNVELDVVYSSPVARAQRVSELESIEGALGSSMPLAQALPEIIDNLNPDEYLRTQFKLRGASQSVLRTKAEVDELRQARAEAQQAALQQQQQAMQVDQAAKLAPMVTE